MSPCAPSAVSHRSVITGCWNPRSPARRPPPSAIFFDAYLDVMLAWPAALLAPSPRAARNHALIDGNKRLALAATIAFYGVNGRRLTLTNDEAYELVMNVAEGKLDSVDDIAAFLATATKPGQ